MSNFSEHVLESIFTDTPIYIGLFAAWGHDISTMFVCVAWYIIAASTLATWSKAKNASPAIEVPGVE